MKKKLLILTLLLLVFVTIADAQSRRRGGSRGRGRGGRGRGGSEAQNVIKLKPVGLVIGAFTGQYERALSENFSVALDLTYMYKSVDAGIGSLMSSKAVLSGFGFSPEARFYFGGSAPKGFFAAGFFEYYSLAFTVEGTNYSGVSEKGTLSGMNSIGGGILLGYQFIIGGVFSIESSLGARFLSASAPTTFELEDANGNKSTETFPSLTISGFLPAGNLSLGFAF